VVDGSVTIDGNTTVTATFTQNEYTLTVNVVGNGSVSRSKAGPYHYADSVQLTATPAPGWVFSGWSGGLTSIESTVVIVMDGNKNVTATFTFVGFPTYLPLVVR
jgi:uncharacterized repeat protein (TIGR02543 family)